MLFGPLNDPLNTVFNIVSSAGGKQGHVKALALVRHQCLQASLKATHKGCSSGGRWRNGVNWSIWSTVKWQRTQYRSHHFFRSELEIHLLIRSAHGRTTGHTTSMQGNKRRPCRQRNPRFHSGCPIFRPPVLRWSLCSWMVGG